MTGLQYVKHRLQQDFRDRSHTIIRLLDLEMEALLKPAEIEDELTTEFHTLLNDSVYPFLACYQAMQDAGVNIHFADRYVRKISDELDDEKKQNVIVPDRVLRMD